MINRNGRLVVDEHFTEPLSPFWDVAEIGSGTVRAGGGTLDSLDVGSRALKERAARAEEQKREPCEIAERLRRCGG